MSYRIISIHTHTISKFNHHCSGLGTAEMDGQCATSWPLCCIPKVSKNEHLPILWGQIGRPSKICFYIELILGSSQLSAPNADFCRSGFRV